MKRKVYIHFRILYQGWKKFTTITHFLIRVVSDKNFLKAHTRISEVIKSKRDLNNLVPLIVWFLSRGFTFFSILSVTIKNF